MALAQKQKERWMLKTTRGNLALIADRRKAEDNAKWLNDIVADLDRAAQG